MTNRELLRRHLEAVWGLTLPAFDEASHELVLPAPRLPPWSLYLATFAGEQMTIIRPDVSPEQLLRLREQARALEGSQESDTPAAMRREVVFHSPIITPQQQARAARLARVLDAADAALIESFEAGSAAYFLDPRAAPAVGVVVDGRLVSLAHSSRQTPDACELGIETLPEARRRGYAAAATILWTALVQQKGLMPIYSAFAWNGASLRLAQSVGYAPRITGIYGPSPAADGQADAADGLTTPSSVS